MMTMNEMINEAIRLVVYNTRYTPYQCMRVAELSYKYGDKAKYHMTKKQLKIVNELTQALEAVEKCND